MPQYLSTEASHSSIGPGGLLVSQTSRIGHDIFAEGPLNKPECITIFHKGRIEKARDTERVLLAASSFLYILHLVQGLECKYAKVREA